MDNNQTAKTANSLKYSISLPYDKDQTIYINIKLADECKNGHNDFSITGDIYKGVKIDRNFISGGCIHEDILKVKPEFKLFVDLHLSDYKGCPTYAIANGFYFLKNDTKETTEKYLRLINSEYETLKQAENEAHFKYLLYSLKIPSRWQIEANEAIKVLEGLTGITFVDNSKRSQLEDITQDEINLIESNMKNGYYLADKVEERENKKATDAKNKIIADLTATKEKAILKADIEFNIKMAIVNAGLSLKNFIYYNHTNNGVFNWLDYEAKITENQLNTFKDNVDYSALPENITFELKK